MAVTKGFGPEAVRAALAPGSTAVGENYADELVAKAAAVADDPGPAPEWHFLGAIQRNKVPRLAPLVSCWQSVGRIEEGRAIARRRPGRPGPGPGGRGRPARSGRRAARPGRRTWSPPCGTRTSTWPD